MKAYIVCLVLVISLQNTFAQENALGTPINIQLPNNLNITLKNSDSNRYNKQLTPNIKKENWHTTVYQPVIKMPPHYPISIFFSDSTFAAPVTHKKVITSRYGWRNGRAHKGIDIDLKTGDTVKSILSGIVRYASYSRGHGKTIVVRHFNGLETTYAHLSHIAVKANDTVSKGQYIGKGGNTGNSRGSHLHLVTSYKGQYINPEYLFDFSASNRIRSNVFWITKKWTQPVLHSSKGLAKITVYKTKSEALASLVKQRKIYVVKKGDTLYRISKNNHTSVAAICRTNKISQKATLRIGQTLLLEI